MFAPSFSMASKMPRFSGRQIVLKRFPEDHLNAPLTVGEAEMLRMPTREFLIPIKPNLGEDDIYKTIQSALTSTQESFNSDKGARSKYPVNLGVLSQFVKESVSRARNNASTQPKLRVLLLSGIIWYSRRPPASRGCYVRGLAHSGSVFTRR